MRTKNRLALTLGACLFGALASCEQVDIAAVGFSPEMPALVLGGAGGAPAEVATEFIRTEGDRFFLGDAEYRALGVTMFPLLCENEASTEAQMREVMLSARNAGISLLHFTCLHSTDDDATIDDHLGEGIWARVDEALALAEELDLHVIMGIDSALRMLDSPTHDYTSGSNREDYDRYWTAVVTRRNTITGRLYLDEPAIFSWVPVGLIVPEGVTEGLWREHSVENYLSFAEYSAARIKLLDRNHLVGIGGLRYLSKDSFLDDATDSSGQEYWKSLWSLRVIDYAAVQLYPSDIEQRPAGEWANLSAYQAFASSLEKPLIVGQWGADRSRASHAAVVDYFDYVYEQLREHDVPISSFWNWGSSTTFGVYPGASPEDDELVAIIAGAQL
jgi:hypothetical protein